MSDGVSTLNLRPSLWNKPYVLLTVTACLWASNFVVGRALPTSLSPISLSFWRWATATVTALPFAWSYLREDRQALLRHWQILTKLAALGLAGSNTLAYLALRETSATSVLLVQSAMPISILGFGMLLFGDRTSGRQLLAMAFAACGVLCVILGKPGATGAFNGGTMLAVLAMLSQSLYATVLRCRPSIHPASFLFATFCLATLIMLPLQIWQGPFLPRLDRQGLGAIAYLALGPSMLAFFLFNRGVQLVGSSRAGLFFYLMPVFGTVFAAIVLHEQIEAIELGGFALVGAGFVLSCRRN